MFKTTVPPGSLRSHPEAARKRGRLRFRDGPASSLERGALGEDGRVSSGGEEPAASGDGGAVSSGG